MTTYESQRRDPREPESSSIRYRFLQPPTTLKGLRVVLPRFSFKMGCNDAVNGFAVCRPVSVVPPKRVGSPTGIPNDGVDQRTTFSDSGAILVPEPPSTRQRAILIPGTFPGRRNSRSHRPRTVRSMRRNQFRSRSPSNLEGQIRVCSQHTPGHLAC